MRILRALALVVNAAWVVLGLIVAFVAITSEIGPSLAGFMLVLIATAAASTVVIVKDWRGQRVSRVLRVSAFVLNAAWLFFAVVGWTTALSGGPGPSGLASALPAMLLTLMTVLNLVVMAGRARAQPAEVAAPGT